MTASVLSSTTSSDNATARSGALAGENSMAGQSTTAGDATVVEDIITGLASGPLGVPIWAIIRQNIALRLTARIGKLSAP